VISRQKRWKRKRYAEDPEFRERTLAANRAWRAAHKDRLNARQRQRWATDPQYRAKQLAAHRSSIERRRRKAATDPVYRTRFTALNRARHRRRGLKARYRISCEEYEALWTQQGGACAICMKSSDETRCVDHCHATGKVPGLLCRHCNLGLGFYGDDPGLMQAAMAYLRRTSIGEEQV
jgi:hypothetical protein